jgi:hypothetical protein
MSSITTASSSSSSSFDDDYLYYQDQVERGLPVPLGGAT